MKGSLNTKLVSLSALNYSEYSKQLFKYNYVLEPDTIVFNIQPNMFYQNGDLNPLLTQQSGYAPCFNH